MFYFARVFTFSLTFAMNLRAVISLVLYTSVICARQMCDNRYLHMPVVDEDSGEVMGVVDVMEIIEAMVGQEGSAG